MQPTTGIPRVEVVAAVIEREDGTFLLAQRPAGKAYAGYWEFPGGKVEPGETPAQAVRRELAEELGIDVQQAYPWITREYDYEHAAVRLRFHRVTHWRGEPHGRESQAFAWQRIDAVTVGPLLPANGPVMRALALPRVYAITHAGESPVEVFVARARSAFAGGLKLVQVREPAMCEVDFERFARRMVCLAHDAGARALVNGDADLARRIGADGVHLSSRRLMQIAVRPRLDLVAASCHDADELRHAAALGVDFVVLGPVNPTPSHPGTPAMGFERFARLVDGCSIPVYALGGLRMPDAMKAWQAGAHGIAMMRGAWE